MNCEICGAPATHLCTGCGKYLCDSIACAAKGAASAIRSNPVQAVKSAPAAVAHAIGVLADGLGFKP